MLDSFYFFFIIALCFIDSSSADTDYNTNLRTRRLIVDFVLFKKSAHLDTLVCFLAYHSSTSILSRSSASLEVYRSKIAPFKLLSIYMVNTSPFVYK